jgi:hypothetical protein
MRSARATLVCALVLAGVASSRFLTAPSWWMRRGLHLYVLLYFGSCRTGAETRYGYNDNGVALHWNEISSRPAWPAYPVQPAVETSLEELESQGVKILRVRLRGTQASRINSDGVAAESSLALARSTQEATGTGEWTKARPCGEIDFLLRRCLGASQVQILKRQLHSAAI